MDVSLPVCVVHAPKDMPEIYHSFLCQRTRSSPLSPYSSNALWKHHLGFSDIFAHGMAAVDVMFGG